MTNSKAALTRRHVVIGLAGTGAIGIAAAAPTGKLARAGLGALTGRKPGTSRPASLANASYAEWVRAVGAIFALDGGYRLRLTGVRAMGSSTNRSALRGLRTHAFTATFQVLGGQTMGGDLIYTATYGRDSFPLFLSATGTGSRMQAAFG